MVDNVHISGAFFDNNMPQWATEETLSRLSQQIKNSDNLTRNQQNKIIGLLGGIAQTLKTGNDKKMLEEMRKFNKMLDDARSDIVDSNEKTSKEISGKIDKQTEAIEKQTEVIESSSGDGSGGSKQKQINVKELTELTKDVNNNIKSMSSTLNEFHKSFMNISTESLKVAQGTKESMLGSGPVGGAKREVKIESAIDEKQAEQQLSPKFKGKPSQKKEQKLSGGEELTDSIRDTNDLFRDIIDKLVETDASKGKDATDVEALGKHSTEQISIFNQQRRSDEEKGFTGRAADKLRSGREKASKVKASFGMLNSVVGKLITPLTILSGAVSGLTALGAAFTATKDVIWDAQQEIYGAMHETGISFTQFNTNLQNVEDDIRMDGIRLRRMIAEAGILAEKGIEVIRKNTVLMNRMGTEGFFGAVENIAGDAKDMESFMNQMMLSREQIAEFTAEYMSSLIKVSGQLRMNEDSRQHYVRQFIKDASQFSRVVGKGIDEITGRVSEMREDDRMRLMQMRFRGDRESMQNFETTSAMLTSLNVGEDVKTALEDALYDPRGIGLRTSEMGQNIMNTMSRLGVGGAATDLNQLIKDQQKGEVGAKEFAKRLGEIRTQIQESDQSEEEINALLAGNEQQRRAANLLTGVMQIDDKMLKRMEEGEKVSPAGMVGEVTQQQKLAQSAIEATKAQLEEEKVKAFDSDAGREAAVKSFEMAVRASDLTEKLAGFVSSIASTVMNTLPGILDGMNYIVSWLGGESEEERENRKEYEKLMASYNKDVSGTLEKIEQKATDTKDEDRKENLKRKYKDELGMLMRAKEYGEGSRAWRQLKNRGLNEEQIKEQIKNIPSLMKQGTLTFGDDFANKVNEQVQRFGRANKERSDINFRTKDVREMTYKQLQKEKDKILQDRMEKRGVAIPQQFEAIKPVGKPSEISEKQREELKRLEQRLQAVERTEQQQRDAKAEELEGLARDTGFNRLSRAERIKDITSDEEFDKERYVDRMEDRIDDKEKRERMIKLLEEIARSTRNTQDNTKNNL